MTSSGLSLIDKCLHCFINNRRRVLQLCQFNWVGLW